MIFFKTKNSPIAMSTDYHIDTWNLIEFNNITKKILYSNMQATYYSKYLVEKIGFIHKTNSSKTSKKRGHTHTNKKLIGEGFSL